MVGPPTRQSRGILVSRGEAAGFRMTSHTGTRLAEPGSGGALPPGHLCQQPAVFCGQGVPGLEEGFTSLVSWEQGSQSNVVQVMKWGDQEVGQDLHRGETLGDGSVPRLYIR